jgi:hypothetical protein
MNYGGSSSINTTATLVPLGIDVASWLLRGSGWGLALTALGLLYTGYEFQQDFANKRAKGLPSPDEKKMYSLRYRNNSVYNGYVYTVSSAQTKFQAYMTTLGSDRVAGNCYLDFSTIVCPWKYSYEPTFTRITNFSSSVNADYEPSYTPSALPIYVPLDIIGDKIIELANQGNTEAQALINAVSDSAWTSAPATLALQAKLENQLNANAQHPSDTQASSTTTGLASSTNPNASGTTTTSSNTETQTELPAFCKYASKLCDWLDWSQKLPEDEEKKEVEIKTSDITFNQTAYINVSGSCPPPVSISFGILGNLSIDFSMFCNVLIIIRPAVVSASFLGAIFIVMGVRDE